MGGNGWWPLIAALICWLGAMTGQWASLSSVALTGLLYCEAKGDTWCGYSCSDRTLIGDSSQLRSGFWLRGVSRVSWGMVSGVGQEFPCFVSSMLRNALLRLRPRQMMQKPRIIKIRTTPPAAIPTLASSVRGPLSNQSGSTEATGVGSVTLTLSLEKIVPSVETRVPGFGCCSHPA